ncbi:hypothetical protein SLE2022_333520 [Rubroshorea leprosula]
MLQIDKESRYTLHKSSNCPSPPAHAVTLHPMYQNQTAPPHISKSRCSTPYIKIKPLSPSPSPLPSSLFLFFLFRLSLWGAATNPVQ